MIDPWDAKTPRITDLTGIFTSVCRKVNWPAYLSYLVLSYVCFVFSPNTIGPSLYDILYGKTGQAASYAND